MTQLVGLGFVKCGPRYLVNTHGLFLTSSRLLRACLNSVIPGWWIGSKSENKKTSPKRAKTEAYQKFEKFVNQRNVCIQSNANCPPGHGLDNIENSLACHPTILSHISKPHFTNWVKPRTSSSLLSLQTSMVMPPSRIYESKEDNGAINSTHMQINSLVSSECPTCSPPPIVICSSTRHRIRSSCQRGDGYASVKSTHFYV